MILQRDRTIGLEHWRPNSVLALFVGDFALLGIVVGAQGVLWASLMAALHITKSAFGGALLTSPLMAVLLLLLGGHLSAMIGKKRMAVLSLFLMGIASLILGAAGTLGGFLAALLVRGAGWKPPGVLAAVASLAGVMLVATLCVTYPRLGTQTITDIPGATLRLMIGSRPLRVLSVIGALGAVGESIIFLWSVIYLRERGASPMMGGLAFSLLSSAMMAGRLANIGIVRRFGLKASIYVSGMGLLCSS